MDIKTAFKNIVAYTVSKRFFVTILKTDKTKEIIADADIENGSEITIHRPILLRQSLFIKKDLFLGKKLNKVNDEHGKLLHTNISNENCSTGEMLGFHADRCMGVYPKEFIFLKPLNPKVESFNNINFSIEEFNNTTKEINWVFVLPSYILTNKVKLQFYFLNPSEYLGTVSYKYSIHMTNSDNYVYKDLNLKVGKGVTVSDNFMTNIIVKEYDFSIQNNLCCLRLFRNKNMGTMDNFEHSLGLIGVKIEYENNFFSK